MRYLVGKISVVGAYQLKHEPTLTVYARNLQLYIDSGKSGRVSHKLSMRLYIDHTAYRPIL